MTQNLTISMGQCSNAGRKGINQDFFGALIPVQPALTLKGIAIALTDGISSSSVSQIAAESTVKSFLTDYYCTSDAWTVKTSALRVIHATNSWLHAETKRSQHAYDMDKGYVCTLSAMVLKSHDAHIFHIGDSRVYRMSGDNLEQLTTDHRTVISSEQTYLARAIGMGPRVEVDYQKVRLEIGDIFILATDGVYEHTDARFVAQAINANTGDLDEAARTIVADALERGSGDNLTIQIIRIDALPDAEASDFISSNADHPAPPLLEARDEFDGYEILREIHSNHRSHIYLARDIANGTEVALKIPSIDLRENTEYLKRFMMEEWIARRINNAHVLKTFPQIRQRNYIYVITEYIEGQTLAQWMIDNPRADLETVRGIVEQIAKGLRAFHRKEMVHQDLRPENIMIDSAGTVKIIDFGATKVAGVIEAEPFADREEILGTLQYAAPEYFLGQTGTRRSDLFSLGVIAYQMLTGNLPYGAQVSRTHTKAQQNKLRYASVQSTSTTIPDWVDEVLKKAVHPDPLRRYERLSEFTTDLRTPSHKRTALNQRPLAERNPVVFWKSISLILALVIMVLLSQ